jgi:DNA-binding CsgD family transcriptional regulator
MAKKLTKEIVDKIHKLGKEGKGPVEISKLVGVNRDTVAKYLKQIGIFKEFKKLINQEDFENLWKEGKTDEEIAEFFGCSVLTIKSFRTKGGNAGKFNIVRYLSQTDSKLSDLQKQMVLGSLLGDMSLGFTHKGNNARLSLVHSEKQAELFKNKTEILGEFMGSYRLQVPKTDPRTGKVYKTYRGNSKAHKDFTDIYNILYKNGVKTISQEYLDLINHPIALAFWFMDDGANNGTIATNCFTDTEVNLLIEWLNKKWKIKATKQKNLNNFVIHISAKSRLDFELLIFPYIIPSMYYKLKNLQILQAESV